MTGGGAKLALYCAGHFWVDFCCALLMFSTLRGGGQWAVCVLVYNFCAFALQMPLGIAADRLNRNSTLAALGCVLVGLAYGMAALPVWMAVAAGVGNALFHIGGGVDVLNTGTRRSAGLGMFVSPGALGLFLGAALGKGTWDVSRLAPVGLLLALAAAIPGLDLFLRRTLRSGNGLLSLALPRGGGGALVCLFLVVALRSYLGMTLSFPWTSAGYWAVATTCALVLGKTAGGFLGDRMGMARAGALSLGLSALLFWAGGAPLAGVAAVFLFNMTMPITLWAAARLLPGGRGFAFGTLTFALFLGYLPVFLGWSPPIAGPALYSVGALLSLGLLRLGLRRGVA